MNLKLRLSVLQFLQFFIWGSWFVTAGTYLQQTLGFTGLQVGSIYATTAIAATISPFVVGILADRFFSVEKLLSILHLLGGVLLWTVSRATSYDLFYLLMLLYVLCYLPTFSLSNALCFHHLEDAQRDFPRVRVWGTLAWIVIGIIIGWLEVEDQVLPFQIAAACSFLQGLYCFTLPATPPRKQQESLWQSLRSAEVRALFADRKLRVLTLALALICIPSAYYYSFVNPFLNEMGVANAAGKMAIGQVTELLLMLALPWIFRKWSLRFTITLGLLLWGLRYGLFILGIEGASEGWFIAGIFLHGPAYIFSMLSAQIYLDTRFPTHLRSTGQGFFSLLTLGLGVFVGSYIAGQTVSLFTIAPEQHDWVSIWWLPTIVGVLTAVFFGLFFRQESTTSESKPAVR